MKTTSSILFLLMFCLFFKLDAQRNTEHNYIIFNYSGQNTDDKPYVASMKGKTVDYEIIKTKNSKRSKYVKTFNEDGRMSSFYEYVEGNKRPLQLTTFNDSGFVVNNKVYNKKGLKSEVKISRKNYKKINEIVKIKKGKEYSKKIYHSKDSDCDTASYWYKNGKLKRQWAYEYYKACERKRSVLMDADGKVLKEWNYDCKSEGEIVNVKKNSTKVCNWEEVDDKHIMYITQSINDKGKATKTIFMHRRSDTNLVNIKYYDHLDRLSSYIQYDPDAKYRILKSEHYKNNGKPYWIEKYNYRENKLQSITERSGGKWFNKVDYEYNEKEELSKLVFHKKQEGNIYRETLLTYN